MPLTREICKCCGRENPLGFEVPDDVWERAVPPEYRNRVLCIMCFDYFATLAGVDWTEYPIKFWPVSGVEAIKAGMSAYGITELEVNCKQCGHCCILHPTVFLTPEEAASGKYNIRKKRADGRPVLKKKTVYIKELNLYKGVCYYLDLKTRKCTIHNDKPQVCRNEFCGGGQYLSEWNPFKEKSTENDAEGGEGLMQSTFALSAACPGIRQAKKRCDVALGVERRYRQNRRRV